MISEPNTYGENCVEMMVGKEGAWNDIYCAYAQPAICEKRGDQGSIMKRKTCSYVQFLNILIGHLIFPANQRALNQRSIVLRRKFCL